MLLVGTVGAVPAFDGGKSGTIARVSGNGETVMVVGDSVAYVLADEGIVPQRERFDMSVVNGAFHACTPMASQGTIIDTRNGEVYANREDCSEGYPGLIERFHPDVVLVLYGGQDNFSIELGGKQRRQCEPLFKRTAGNVLERQVDQLATGGATVVLSTKPGISDRAVQDRYGLGDSMELTQCDNDVVRRVAAKDPRARLVDLAAFVCPDDRCIEEVDGVTLRSDGTHFRQESARYVARWLVPQMLAAARRNK